MTDNKIIGAFKRLLTMTLALVMVLGSAMPLVTQEVSAFNGKVGSKYTVHWYKELHYGPGEGGYSNAAKCDLGDDLGSRFSICVQPNKNSPVWEAAFPSAYSRIKTPLYGSCNGCDPSEDRHGSQLWQEGLITDNEEYLYLQQKIRDKYREDPDI